MENKNALVRIASAENPVVTSINATTMADKVRFYNAINQPTGDIRDMINTELTISDFHMTRTDGFTDDGEPYDKITTTVICEDGRSYSTTYRSFAKSLVQFMSIFGTPDTWENHVMKIKVQTVKYSGGMHDGLTITAVI